MIESFAHYRRKLAEKGLRKIIVGRLRWYKDLLLIDNWLIGKLIEAAGNKVTLDGVVLSVDNPLIKTRHKSTIYFGIYEVGERKFTKRYIDRKLPLVEIGGSIGGVACITNRLLDNPAHHVVVECNPLVMKTLELNKWLNHSKFSIEPKAVAYDAEFVSFSVAEDHFMTGRVGGEGGKIVSVPTITLEQILDKYKFGTANLICDSEGGEVEMVQNEIEVLSRKVKWLIVETHPAERGAGAIVIMLAKLKGRGFEIVNQEGPVIAMVNRQV